MSLNVVEALFNTNVNLRMFPKALEARQDLVTVYSTWWHLDNLQKKLSGNQWEQHDAVFGCGA